MKKTLLLVACIWVVTDLEAQPIHFPKLVIKMGEVLDVTSDEVHIDTLIMQDNSRITFLASETKLMIDHAFIGKNCTWDASGRSAGKTRNQASALRAAYTPMHPVTYGTASYGRGQNSEGPKGSNGAKGMDGEPGRNLQVVVLFDFLGELTVDVSGGYGRMGRRGTNGGHGQNGSNIIPTGGTGGDGGIGGNGGDGGKISLSYACTGFTQALNEGGFRSIFFKYHGGKGGTGGAPGRGGAGGMPRRTYDYSTLARVAPINVPVPAGSDGPEKTGPVLPVKSDITNPTGYVAEWEGQRGHDASSGRMGMSGADGKDGALILTKLK